MYKRLSSKDAGVSEPSISDSNDLQCSSKPAATASPGKAVQLWQEDSFILRTAEVEILTLTNKMSLKTLLNSVGMTPDLWH